MKKFLIVGLGNPGIQYQNTRHNIGYEIVDYLAKEQNIDFESQKLADVIQFKHKGRKFILVKPITFMNLSGKAVRYWMQKEDIKLEHLLVITDDVNLDFGTIRIKPKGSHGGHNGLNHIQDILNSKHYPRFRFGIGSNFSRGQQIDYVLGNWNKEEESKLIERLEKAKQAILSFGLAGIDQTMNDFNGK